MPIEAFIARRSWPLFLALAAGFAAPQIAAQSQDVESFELKGLRLGESEAIVSGHLGQGAHCSAAEQLPPIPQAREMPDVDRVCTNTLTFGGQSALAIVGLTDDRAEFIRLSLEREHFSLMTGALSAKFGPPAQANTVMQQEEQNTGPPEVFIDDKGRLVTRPSRFTVPVLYVQPEWTRGDELLVAKENPDQDGRMRVELTSPDTPEKRQRRAEEEMRRKEEAVRRAAEDM